MPSKTLSERITWHPELGWPIPALADDANTGEDLIREVYDQSDQFVRGAARREHLDGLDP